MKHLNLILFFGMSLFMSCDVERENELIQNLKGRSQTEMYRLIAKNDYLVLLKESVQDTDLIYILFDNKEHEYQQSLEVRNIVTSETGIDIQLAAGYNLQWSVDENSTSDQSGYGLSILKGKGYFPFFYGSSGPLQDPDVNIVKCRCRPEGQNYNCDSGGRGATECSVEHRGSMMGTGMDFKCSVKCGEGFYACCSNL